MSDPGSKGRVAVLAAALLFNLGQGALRPTLPLFLQSIFLANYRMVTSIPMVFGIGKWIASVPTGYLLDRVGRRRMMGAGLLLIALCDVASVTTSAFGVFLGLRALGGVGWAMFGTVATTTMVDLPDGRRRGRAVSALLMSETLGLLLGTAGGGWLYQGLGGASPFVFEAACMLVAALTVVSLGPPDTRPAGAQQESGDRHLVTAALREPGVVLMGLTNAALTAIQTGAVVFLVPLYMVARGSLGPELVGVEHHAGQVPRRSTRHAVDRRQRFGPVGPRIRAGPRPPGLCDAAREPVLHHASGGARGLELCQRRGRRLRGAASGRCRRGSGLSGLEGSSDRLAADDDRHRPHPRPTGDGRPGGRRGSLDSVSFRCGAPARGSGLVCLVPRENA